jgi:hypothetical protein
MIFLLSVYMTVSAVVAALNTNIIHPNEHLTQDTEPDAKYPNAYKVRCCL